jgi:hypothetical protein
VRTNSINLKNVNASTEKFVVIPNVQVCFNVDLVKNFKLLQSGYSTEQLQLGAILLFVAHL